MLDMLNSLVIYRDLVIPGYFMLLQPSVGLHYSDNPYPWRSEKDVL
jgi:hypothetical protein